MKYSIFTFLLFLCVSSLSAQTYCKCGPAGECVAENGTFVNCETTCSILGNTGISSGYSSITSCQEAPLPIHLSSFDARISRSYISLVWTTSYERLNKGFNVQKSLDGNNFKTVGYVEGKGTSTSTVEYTYDDKEIKGGQVYYYRLEQVDYDGTSSFSKIIAMKAEGISISHGALYPNPSHAGYVHFSTISESSETLNISVFDQFGRLVQKDSVDLESGYNDSGFDASRLSAGIYTVQIGDGVNAYFQKLVIK